MPTKKKTPEPTPEKVDVIKTPKTSKRKPKGEDINETVEKGGPMKISERSEASLRKKKVKIDAPKPEKRTCAGQTKAGANCRRNVKGDATHCSIHLSE